MDTLVKQVRLAQRRLNVQVFVRALTWSWGAAFTLAAGLVTLDKFVPLGLLWWAWPAGAAMVGLVAAGVWTFYRRRRSLEAAVELDRRFGLKERISSCLALAPTERETPFGQALVADATARAARLHVGERFGVTWNGWSVAPLLPALAAVLVGLFVAPALVENPAAATTVAQAQKEQIKRSTETLQKRLEEQKKKAEAKGLEEAKELMEQLQRGAEQLKKDEPAERKDALVKLNDLAEQVKQRREKLGDTNQVKKMLDQLKGVDRGPADRLADAMRKGDFKQALNELDKLKDQLKNGKLDEAQKEKLAKQLEQMADKVRQMADAQEQKKKQLEEEIKKQRAAGNAEEADKLEKELKKVEQQCAQCQKQGNAMADKLKQAAASMKDGKFEQAAEQLSQMSDELSEMAKQADEMEMLDDLMDQLADAKDQMGCKECQGQGCKVCQGKGKGNGQGDGPGKGRGQGDRPEAEDDTKSYDSQVRQKVGRGAALVTDLVDGPNAKGRVLQEIQAELDAAQGGETDPLADQPLPRSVRDHARDYFDGLREGQPH